MDIPKAITLFSEDGYHAGFMLLAPKSQDAGDCVFMLTPISKEGINSKLGIVVSELKVAGEHKFLCSKSNSGIEITVKPKNLPEVNFIFNYEFLGEIFTEFDGKKTFIGTADAAKKKGS